MGVNILTEPSLSKENITLFIVCQVTAFFSIPAYAFAASLLWQSKWYDLIKSKVEQYIAVAPGWLMGIMWFLYSESLALGLFFLMKDFANPQAHHPADYGFVTGWLLGGIGAGILYPVAVTSFCNQVPSFLCCLGALIGIGVSFGLQVFYTQQDHPHHLQLSDPSMWLLVFPILWQIYICFVAGAMAVISMTDSDYLERCAEDRKVIGTRNKIVEDAENKYGGGGNMIRSIAEQTLAPTTATASLIPSVNHTSGMQHKKDKQQAYNKSNYTYDD